MSGRPVIWVLNGPNLNLLGTREPDIYGTTTLSDIEALCRKTAGELGLDIGAFRQTNHEGQLVDWLQQAAGQAQGILLNAAAYTHTSVAILDAMKAIGVPVVEVHLSDPSSREAFRHHSYVSQAAVAEVKGLGAASYEKALHVMKEHLEKG